MRTGLALMGFGFVVARFGLFLREFPVVTSIIVSIVLTVLLNVVLWFLRR
jgi:uncharacterized membrane protein YidH (DUF202 family)